MKSEATAGAFTRDAFRTFVDGAIAPEAGEWDRDGHTPDAVLARVAARGYLGMLTPSDLGGGGVHATTFVALHEEMGRGCSSIRSLLTVHEMVSFAIRRWGSPAQRTQWLPSLASGNTIAAFALSEPEAGSDAAAIETSATIDRDDYLLHGTKQWITYGQVAGLFLVVAQANGKPIALLVERGAPGLEVVPLPGVTGTRASMLATLRFTGCRVSRSARVGGEGFGLGVALSALELGRLSVAAGSTGIIQACLDASARYAAQRRQFGRAIGEQQLVRRLLADMAVDAHAARLLCLHAAQRYDAGDPHAIDAILVAKYFASTAAVRAATSAVQIHGANGCTDRFPVDRFLRDARVMEIIEGSTQVLQDVIGRDTMRSVPAVSGREERG